MDSSLKSKKFGVVHTSPSEMISSSKLEVGKLYFAQGDASGAAKQGVYALTNMADADGITTPQLTMFGCGAIVDANGPGLMSSADKNKLDGIENGANKYIHPALNSNASIAITEFDEGNYAFTSTNNNLKVITGGHRDASGHISKLLYTDVSLPATAFSDTIYTHPVAGKPTKSFGATEKGTTVTPGTLTKIATIYDASFDASGHFTGVTARDISINISKPATATTADKVSNTFDVSFGGQDIITYNGSANKTLAFNKGTNINITNDNGTLTFATTGVPTITEMNNAISSALSSALQYKGVVNDTSVLPITGNKLGDVYVCSTLTSGKEYYETKQNDVSIRCETGDIFIWNGNYFDVVNGENQVSNANATLTWNASTKIATVDGTDIYVKLPVNPNSDSKVATSSSTSKLFLIGKTDGNKNATSTANYNASAYIDSDGYLYSGGAKVLTSYTEQYKGTVTSITPGIGLTGTSTDTPITSSGTINLKTATTSEIGGMIASNVLTSAVTLTSASGTTASRYYGVQVDNTGKAFVNVPWTDNDTKVTSVGNHYIPTTNTNNTLSVDASSATAASWGTTDLVTGVNILRDAAGHVTGVTVDSIQMPSNPNTDTKNTAGSTNSTSKLFLIGATSQVASTQTYSNSNVYINTSNQIVANSGEVKSGNTALVNGNAVYTAVEAATIYWETL